VLYWDAEKIVKKEIMIIDLFKDILKYLPAQIVPAMMGFISIPIITRLFDPADYANYILVIATVSVLITIVGWLPMSIIYTSRLILYSCI